jgi:hypothetical protein
VHTSLENTTDRMRDSRLNMCGRQRNKCWFSMFRLCSAGLLLKVFSSHPATPPSPNRLNTPPEHPRTMQCQNQQPYSHPQLAAPIPATGLHATT